ncbi:MAG: hypothetical protein KQJ78_02970 [Deltaproteobacteria bacterium]|nr:hypothetical protein [Deltaproteobacteria bacterium]
MKKVSSRLLWGGLSVLLVLLVAGCEKTNSYTSAAYATPKEALAARQEFNGYVPARIDPTTNRLGGKAALIIPTYDTFIAWGFERNGIAQTDFLYFVGQGQVYDYEAFAECLKKRAIFDSVELIEDKYPYPAAKKAKTDHDVVIYLRLVSEMNRHWYVMAEPSYEQREIVVATKEDDDLLPRVEAWLAGLEKNLNEMGYRKSK